VGADACLVVVMIQCGGICTKDRRRVMLSARVERFLRVGYRTIVTKFDRLKYFLMYLN
jgi:hypothetical protein